MIMDNDQDRMYDVDDAELIELYETWLRQQAAGTDPGRKCFI